MMLLYGERQLLLKSFYKQNMCLEKTAIEIINPKIIRGQIRHVLFDFDGTLSLIRTGWQRIMASLMVETLLRTPKGRELGEEKIQKMVTEYIDASTGLQTIFQMKWLAKKVTDFGGKPASPWEYKRLYNERLCAYIAERIISLRTGRCFPEEFLVPGTQKFLATLRDLGVRCYLASGTDEEYVKEEARLLQIDKYFAGIYGAQKNWQDVKRRIIKNIIKQHRLQGHEFAAFGDGFVEIQETKAVNGIAVGVASDEVAPGRLNLWKRQRLIRAGADLIIPDFESCEVLVKYLFLKEE
jgi:phosphoglycolate phosphatase-like HAD superfamily hydrolase